jgi:NAD(P)-dependent dehydrogenase (short-subunit alcohol dehydrogenase family)
MFASDAFAGATILITGASSGIGRATARLLAGCGARLVLHGRDVGRLDSALAELAGGGHSAVPGSLDDADQTAELVKSAAAAHGPFAGIFHCAGREFVRPIRMTKRQQLDELFGAATFGALGVARAASQKGAVTDGASLLFMSSVAGIRGTAGMVGYSAAKAAVDGMVRSLAAELAPRRIRANALAAGAVQTEMHERLSATLGAEAIADYENRHLLGFGKVEDVAAAAAFLLGGGSAWITGTTFVVDGGYTVR